MKNSSVSLLVEGEFLSKMALKSGTVVDPLKSAAAGCRDVDWDVG